MSMGLSSSSSRLAEEVIVLGLLKKSEVSNDLLSCSRRVGASQQFSGPCPFLGRPGQSRRDRTWGWLCPPPCSGERAGSDNTKPTGRAVPLLRLQ
jgi:hypothetical protein